MYSASLIRSLLVAEFYYGFHEMANRLQTSS